MFVVVCTFVFVVVAHPSHLTEDSVLAFLSATRERPTGVQQTFSTPSSISKNTVQHTDPQDSFRYSLVQDRLQDTRPPTKSCSLNHNKEQVINENIESFT